MRVARVWPVRPLVLAALLLGPLAGCTTSGTQDAPTAPPRPRRSAGRRAGRCPPPRPGWTCSSWPWPLGLARARRAGADPGPPGLPAVARARERGGALHRLPRRPGRDRPRVAVPLPVGDGGVRRPPRGRGGRHAEPGPPAGGGGVDRGRLRGPGRLPRRGRGADRVRRARAAAADGAGSAAPGTRRRTWSPPSPTSPARWRSAW